MVKRKSENAFSDYLKPSKFKSPVPYSGKLFGGILLEPIMTKIIPQPLGIDKKQDDEINKLAKEVTNSANDELTHRILALAEHYAIPIDDDLNATLFAIIKHLGNDFLPGFRLNYRKPETRPNNSHRIGGPTLFKAVNNRRIENRDTVKQACIYLNRHGPSKFKNSGVASLEAAYYTYKKQTTDAEAFFREDEYYARVIRVIGYEAFLDQAIKMYVSTSA